MQRDLIFSPYGDAFKTPVVTASTYPKNPVLGWTVFNSTTGELEVYNGTKWVPAANYALKPVGSGTGTASVGGTLSLQVNQLSFGADTTEDDGHSYTLPANSLDHNGAAVKLSIYGSTAATGNSKRLKLWFGGTAIYDTGAVAANNKSFQLSALITRVSVGNQKAIISGHFNGSVVTASAVVATTKDETTALILKDTAQCGTAAAGDILLEGFMVEALN